MTDFVDPEKTIIKPAADLAAGPPASTPPGVGDALPAGTRLGEFVITGLTATGSFGKLYLAQDYSLGRNVAIREYMPDVLAARGDGISVVPRAPRHAEAFASGLISFIHEARQLARFDHPALVKVHRFWEANGTAYMAMPSYEGHTLTQVLRDMGAAPSEVWLKDLLGPLLEALQVMHAQDCFHLGITPDNILMQNSGRPVLMDSGATRYGIGDPARNPTELLQPGYAPLEQCAGDASVRHGAWTDLYALAAVVYYAIMGQPPPASVQRVVQDDMQPLEQAARGRYSEGFLRTIDGALALGPEKRPQSAAQMRSLLGLEAGAPAASEAMRGQAVPVAGKPPARGKLLWAGLAVAVLAIAGGLFFLVDRSGPPAAASVQEPAAGTAQSAATPAAAVAAATGPSAAASSQELASQASTLDLPASAAQAPERQQQAAAPVAAAPAAGLPPPVPAPVAVATPATAGRASASAPRNNPPRPKPAAAANSVAAARPAAPLADAPPVPPPAAPQPVPVPASVAAAEPPRAPVPAGQSPLDSCGKNRLFLSACIADRCKWAEFMNHPMCVEARNKPK